MILALFIVIASAATASAAEPARYHGGEVQHNPHLYAIFWGSSWTEGKNATQRAETEGFFKTASGSSWEGILTQYFDENGAISSSVGFTSYLDKSVSAPTNVTPGTIQEEFASAVAANGWPHTNDDQFMVMLPSGTTYGEGMKGFCGLHSTVHENELKGTGLQGVAWSIAKGDCILTAVATHEFAETVTDRYPSQPGWIRSIDAGGDEIADKCGSGLLANGITVEKLWDNHLHECTLADANPPRLYAVTDGATGITYQGAIVKGLINPAGRATTYRFEYGTSNSYGSSAPASEVNVGSGWKTLKAEASIQGLKPETTYHYRIVGNNASGQNTGEDMTFVTLNEHAPENTAPPVVTPTTPNRAVPETVSIGTWTNSPTSFTYQWENCGPAGEECGAMPSATGSSFTPGPGTVGMRLRVAVTAINAYGQSTAKSNMSEPVRQIGDINEYTVSSQLRNGIASGPDGNVWVNEVGHIAKITPTGKVTEYALPASAEPTAIAAGPDGNLWFTDTRSTESKIGKITPLGAVTEYTVAKYSYPLDIAVGPDGNLWFTTQSRRVGKITTSGTITEYSALPEGVRSSDIISGPDGKLWVSDFNEHGNLWKVTTAGVGTEVPVPDATVIADLTTGPDGNVWFAVNTKIIGKVVPATGAVTEYPLAGTGVSFVSSLAAGPDGNVWFKAPGYIGRIKPAGGITLYSIASPGIGGWITAGPDGRMWASSGGSWEEPQKVIAIAP